MWTRENRGLYERKGARYPSDLSDAEWALIAPLIPPLIPPAKRGGLRREVDVCEVMNGILYVLETGCQWRALTYSNAATSKAGTILKPARMIPPFRRSLTTKSPVKPWRRVLGSAVSFRRPLRQSVIISGARTGRRRGRPDGDLSKSITKEPRRISEFGWSLDRTCLTPEETSIMAPLLGQARQAFPQPEPSENPIRGRSCFLSQERGDPEARSSGESGSWPIKEQGSRIPCSVAKIP